MSFVRLTFANRDPETYEVGGSVKVDVPTTTVGRLSLSFHPESLVGVEFIDVPSLEPDVPAEPGVDGAEAVSDPGNDPEQTEPEPAPAPKKPAVKKPAAKKKGTTK